MPGACVPSGLPVSLHETQPLGGSDWVPKEMWELVEGGGEATMEELVKKWDEELGGGGGAGAVGGGGAGGGTP